MLCFALCAAWRRACFFIHRIDLPTPPPSTNNKQGKWELIRCQVVCGDQQVPTATIALLNKETNQEILTGV